MFFRSVIKLSSATFISQLLVILALPLLVVLYDPEAFAVYAIYIAAVNLLASAACLRLEHAIVIAKAHHLRYLYSLTLFTTTLSVFVSIFIVVAAIYFEINVLVIDHSYFYLLSVPLGVMLTSLWNINYSFANRNEEYTRIAKTQIGKNTVLVSVQLLFGYIVLVNEYVLIFGHLVSLLIANCLLSSRVGITFSVKRFYVILNTYSQFPKYSAPSIFINTLGKSSIPFFIGAVGGGVVLGYFALIERFLAAPAALLGNAVGRVYYRSAAKVVNDKARAIKLFDTTVIILALTSLCIFAPLYIFPFELIEDMLKPEWDGLFQILPILLPVFMIKFIVVPVSMTTSVYGRQKASLIWNILYSMSLNLCLFMVLSYLGNVETLLNVYVSVSVLFFLIYFFMLRGYITGSSGRSIE